MIPTAAGFSIGSSDAIDDRLVLSKAQMKSANDNVFPQVYISLCTDDGMLYLYNKSNEVDETLGKFRLFDAGKIDVIKLNGEVQTIENKTVNLEVITKAVNDLANYYLKTETYTKDEVDALIDAINKFNVLVVDTLPEGEDINPHTIYFIAKEGGAEPDVYDEYMYINFKWEKIGNTQIDLSAYLKIDGSNGTAEGVSNLINKLTVGESDPKDDDFIVSQYAGGGSETTSYHRRALSKFWNYIKGKISSVLGLTETNYGGNSATATKASQDENGNTIHQNYTRSYQLSASTMAELKAYTNASGAFCGSASISDGPAGNCWYNVQWIPHRNGIGGDNPNYGQLILYPMTLNSSKVYRYQKNSNSWQNVYTYDVGGGLSAVNTFGPNNDFVIGSGIPSSAFCPDPSIIDESGVYIASKDSECGGIHLNGNNIVMWTPCDSDAIRVYDEDDLDEGDANPLARLGADGKWYNPSGRPAIYGYVENGILYLNV